MAGAALLAQGIDRRRAILRFVKGYAKKHGFAPSMQEIAHAVESSKSAARYHVEQLVDEGYLSHTPGKYRSLVVVNDGRYPAPR